MEIDNVFRLKGMVSANGNIEINVVDGYSEVKGHCIRVLFIDAKTRKEIVKTKLENITIKQLKSLLSAFGFTPLDLQFAIPNKEVEMLKFKVEKLQKKNDELKKHYECIADINEKIEAVTKLVELRIDMINRR